MILSREHIQEVVKDYFSQKPVTKVWLFGSYARGDADADSDVDVVVDIDYKKESGLDYFIWFQELQDLFNKKVDVVSKKYINKRLRPFIEQDMVLMYEKS
jgi:predicted nucleotidyltransferase